MHRCARSLVLSHFPDEVKEPRETQIPCPRSHQRGSPRRLTQNCALSCCACVSQFWGVPASPRVDALGLCLTSLGTEPPGRACRKSPGQSPALVARWVLLGPEAAGSRQGPLPHCYSSCHPPNVYRNGSRPTLILVELLVPIYMFIFSL